ncbi:MAG TPA: IPT/TIG domain-containing protein [Acidimicrobiales bacterium]|nr:IPT/TIG domain-containing protein [Acidimicrobiales bacterium]
MVTGTNLTGATQVSFGTAPASNVTVSSSTSLTATAPAGSGTVDVTVTTPAGTSATSPADRFTYTTSNAISAVGSMANSSGSGVTTLGDSPQASGDALVLLVKAHSSSITVSSVSGGGASTWTRLTSYQDGSHDMEVWLGPVTSTGPHTVTVTFSAGVSGVDTDLALQEFAASTGAQTTWSKDVAGGQANPSSTAVPYPSLTPTSSGELYFGYAVLPDAPPAGGSTPGFTFDITADGNIVAFDPSVTSTVAPVATQTMADPSASLAVLISAS